MHTSTSIIRIFNRHQRWNYCCKKVPRSDYFLQRRLASVRTGRTQSVDDSLDDDNKHDSLHFNDGFYFAHNSASRSVDFASVKQGVGTLVATACPAATTDPGSTTFVTHLSTVSHKSPVRLIPTSSSASSLAKQVSVSHYGGGMTRGDTVSLNIHVQPNARLYVRTQGTNRVYGNGSEKLRSLHAKQAKDKENCTLVSTNSVTACVDEHAVLVYAPDPVSLQRGAKYQQNTNYVLKDPVTSNLVAVDWICSGRQFSTKSEHWNHDLCSTRTTLRFAGEQKSHPLPALIDAQSITAEGMFAVASNPTIHAVVTVILSGSIVVSNKGDLQDSVLQRFLNVQSALAAQYTTVRTRKNEDQDHRISREVQHLVSNQLSNGGRVVLGVSKSEITSAIVDFERAAIPLYTIRIAASCNEDVYRILHYCLQPLAPVLDGTECYKDRIVHASQSPPAVKSPNRPRLVSVTPTKTFSVQRGSSVPNQPLLPLTSNEATHSKSNFWAAYMLADSALPIGSFSHSSGIEVASQLGFLRNEENVHQDDSIASFVRTAVISSLQQSAPLIVYSSCLTEELLLLSDAVPHGTNDDESCLMRFLDDWVALDAYAQAMLATNAPACRASLDQGRNLLRVARSALLSTSSDVQNRRNHKVLERMQNLTDDPIIRKSQRDCGHVSTVLGVTTRLLHLNDTDAVRLYGYCVARDIVNAAVRLNLLGPMAGQAILLVEAEPAAQEGIFRAYAAMETSLAAHSGTGRSNDAASFAAFTSAAMGCAPVLDAIHPCHDVLATRLFQT
jgi:urease accessory protein UreH/urease accessory protein UreF